MLANTVNDGAGNTRPDITQPSGNNQTTAQNEQPTDTTEELVPDIIRAFADAIFHGIENTKSAIDYAAELLDSVGITPPPDGLSDKLHRYLMHMVSDGDADRAIMAEAWVYLCNAEHDGYDAETQTACDSCHDTAMTIWSAGMRSYLAASWRIPFAVRRGVLTIADLGGTDGAALIADERTRQQVSERYTWKHDDAHVSGELLEAARAYLFAAMWIRESAGDGKATDLTDGGPPVCWPWDRASWKPSDDNIHNLAKAGALIAAEIDRLQRADAANRPTG